MPQPGPDSRTSLLAARIAALRPGRRRLLVAIAGPPGSGKSTLAAALVAQLQADGCAVALVPMDGFHLDNTVLAARGLLPRKGAPETFDAAGFIHMVGRLRAGAEVVVPLFDRARDLAIAGAAVVPAAAQVVVLEGNYLLFDEDPWRDLAPLWDLSVGLDVPIEVLRDRLVARWRHHGLTPQDAVLRAELNDLPNARRIRDRPLPATTTLATIPDR